LTVHRHFLKLVNQGSACMYLLWSIVEKKSSPLEAFAILYYRANRFCIAFKIMLTPDKAWRKRFKYF